MVARLYSWGRSLFARTSKPFVAACPCLLIISAGSGPTELATSRQQPPLSVVGSRRRGCLSKRRARQDKHNASLGLRACFGRANKGFATCGRAAQNVDDDDDEIFIASRRLQTRGLEGGPGENGPSAEAFVGLAASVGQAERVRGTAAR